MAIGMVITLIIGLVAGYGGTLLTVSPATTTITKTVVAGTVTHTVTQVTTVTTTVTASIPPVTAPDFIKIGLMAPLTGPWSFIGAHLEKGAMLAVEEINNKGGVYVAQYGKKIPLKLISADDKASIDEGTAVIKRLIFSDKVDVIIGIYDTPEAMAVVPIAVEAGVPIIFDGGGSMRGIVKDYSYAFHYEIHTHDWTGAELRFLVEVVKPLVAPDRNLKIAILCEDSPFGEIATEGYTWNKETKNLPIEFVTIVKYKWGETSFQTLMTRIKAAKPDAVIVAATPEQAAHAIEQGIRDVGLKTVYIGLPCLEEPHFYELIGEFGDYVVYDSRFTPHIPYKPVAADFVKKYKEKWGELPSFMAPLTYDMVKIAAYAIESAGTLDKKVIRDALEKLNIPADDFLAPMYNNRVAWDDYHEAHMSSFVIQLRWDKATNTLKPFVVWGPPEVAKTANYQLPPYYEKG
jgi:branched-chain amino acid transport system substrate-binding protein